MPFRPFQIVLIALAIGAASPAYGEKLARYVALLEGGQRVQGEKLFDWHDATAAPKLDNQKLFDAGNSLRWLRDRSQNQPAAPPAFIEMHSGDRLPGTVVDYRTGQERPFEPLPPHLLVQTPQIMSPPAKAESADLRVILSQVRRVVWQRRVRQTYQPGTIFFRDGRSLSFRAIRFGAGSVHLLLPSGNMKASFNDLAEVHLAPVDAWGGYFAELATLCTTAETRLLQVETTAGLIATSSLERFVPRFDGNLQESAGWVHGTQPAWSLDILWIPCKDVVYRRSFLPRDVPLCRLPPAKIEQKNLIGVAPAAAQVNQNLLGGAIRSGGQEFGWGFGVQAKSTLYFDLPMGAKSFRTSVCLDRSVQKGGCIRARIFANDTTTTAPLWESGFIVGSEQVVDTGVIPLGGPAAGQRQLVLQIDPAHEGRPAGADPFDIRDLANWCDPILELDPAVIKAELEKRFSQRFWAWKDATVQLDGAAPSANDVGPELLVYRNDQLPAPGQFGLAAGNKGRTLRITRTFQVGPNDQWLLVSAFRPVNRGQEPKLEIRIGNEPVAEYIPPHAPGNPNDIRPLAIPITAYQRPGGGAITVEVRQLPQPDAAPVTWRSLQLAEQLPTLYTVLEERAKFFPTAAAQTGAATLIDTDRHYGAHSAKLTPTGQFQLRFPQPVAVRERPQWGEARFLRFAFRKKGGGRVALDLNLAAGRTEPARYDAGTGEKAYGFATRLWQDNLPDQWIVLTRDLYADFGALEISGVTLGCPDGEYALFDHIYLAQTNDDFNLIPFAPSAEQTNQQAQQELLKQLQERVSPAFIAWQFADGRGSGGGGVLIRKEGEILTAGHLVRGPNQQVVVTLASGIQVKAKTLGVSRDLDLGLLQITDKGEWPAIPVWNQPKVEMRETFLALTQLSVSPWQRKFDAKVADLRRVFRNTLWVDAEITGFEAGGGLINRQGMLTGLHIRRSQFGGFLYTRINEGELNPVLERLRKSEVFGAWPPGSEPFLGVSGKPAPGGLEITAITPGSPAAAAKLLPGDIIHKVGDKPIANADELPLALAEKDAGQPVEIEYTRAGAAAQKMTLTLAPRVP